MGKSPVDNEQIPRLPFRPFQAWLREMYDKYDSSPQTLAMVTGLSQRRIENYLNGRVYDKKVKDPIIREILIDIPDRALINEGSTSLWEIYPSLYS